MLKKKYLAIVLLMTFSCLKAFSNEGPIVVAVGEAELEGTKIAFFNPNIKNSKDTRVYTAISKIIQNDFSFYQSEFLLVEKKQLADFSITGNSLKNLKSEGVNYAFTLEKTGAEAKFSFYNISTEKEVLSKYIKGNVLKDKRTIAHNISALIYAHLTGKESIFKSRIFFVSDRNGTKRKPVKELYVMDFDGGNKKRLTHHRGTVISPAISRNGKKIVYSLIPKSLKKRSIRLMLFDMETKRSKIISNKKGINAGAIFLPQENEIMLTMSFQGNAELYTMNLLSGKRKRLTKHYSPDVDPSISSDGKILTFLSGRSGTAMIYTMDPSGLEKKVKRISYVGKFNATPRFSPDGKTIVFSSWLDNRFDLFRLSYNGKELYRLTKDFGSNEDPSFSRDGELIAFSSLRVISRRKADQNIYIMSKEGKIWGKITSNFGNCITPRWSN